MKQIKWFSLILAITLTIGLTARAGAQADAPARRTLIATVKSVDLEAKTIILEAKGEELRMAPPAERILFFRRTGKPEDMQPGRSADVRGKFSADQKEVEANAVTIYTERDRGMSGMQGSSRVDGKLVKEGDDWYVEHKGGRVKIVLAEKVSRTTFEPATVEDIKEGVRVNAYGVVDGGTVTRLTMFGIYK